MHAKHFTVLIGSFILVLVLLPGLPAAAQGPTPSDDEVNAIAKQLFCPVCPNEPLDTCSSKACIQWRETIRDKLSEGWDLDQIKQYFVEQYGDRVLSTPPARGFNWLIYIIPPLVFVVGLIGLLRALRSWSKAAEEEPSVSVDKSDPYVARVEDELRKRN